MSYFSDTKNLSSINMVAMGTLHQQISCLMVCNNTKTALNMWWGKNTNKSTFRWLINRFSVLTCGLMLCGMPPSTRVRRRSERARVGEIFSHVRSPTVWLCVNSRWACQRSLCWGSSLWGAPSPRWHLLVSTPSETEKKPLVSWQIWGKTVLDETCL